MDFEATAVWLNGSPAIRLDIGGELNTAVSLAVKNGRIMLAGLATAIDEVDIPLDADGIEQALRLVDRLEAKVALATQCVVPA